MFGKRFRCFLKLLGALYIMQDFCIALGVFRIIYESLFFPKSSKCFVNLVKRSSCFLKYLDANLMKRLHCFLKRLRRLCKSGWRFLLFPEASGRLRKTLKMFKFHPKTRCFAKHVWHFSIASWSSEKNVNVARCFYCSFQIFLERLCETLKHLGVFFNLYEVILRWKLNKFRKTVS